MRLEPTVTAAAGSSHTAHLLEASAFMLLSLGVIAALEHRKTRTPPSPRTTKGWPDARVLVLVLAGAMAASIHFAVAPSHWREDPLYGAFFLAAATAQLVGGLMILWQPHRVVIKAYALGNAALVLLWLATRTVGIPLGAQRGEVESMGVLDLLSTSAECGAVAACGLLLHRRRARATARPVLTGAASRAV